MINGQFYLEKHEKNLLKINNKIDEYNIHFDSIIKNITILKNNFISKLTYIRESLLKLGILIQNEKEDKLNLLNDYKDIEDLFNNDYKSVKVYWNIENNIKEDKEEKIIKFYNSNNSKIKNFSSSLSEFNKNNKINYKRNYFESKDNKYYNKNILNNFNKERLYSNKNSYAVYNNKFKAENFSLNKKLNEFLAQKKLDKIKNIKKKYFDNKIITKFNSLKKKYNII